MSFTRLGGVHLLQDIKRLTSIAFDASAFLPLIATIH